MLRPVRTVAPTDAPVTLAQVKANSRVTTTDDDVLILSLIGAATAHLDGRAGILGRCIVSQTWRADFSDWPRSGDIRLPFPDVSSATVRYFDADNAEQTVDSSLHELLEDSLGAFVRFRDQFDSPAVYRDRSDAIQVTFVSGFGAVEDVPEAIKAAIKIMVGKLYTMAKADLMASKEVVQGVGSTEYADSDKISATVDRAVNALLMPYRRAGL